MRAIEFNNNELYNPGKIIIDTNILLEVFKELSDFEHPT